ncbi:hypothetical protein EA473_04390 [Natrarchaeobius chitinivorans]|uniref:DUF8119 domain-containing protein n=1 Tax=Natrarchaeobius chitinivorans TaxID=1679083 RepID=A0A3N6M9M3_NATCH|nr:hypothetical protein [Natrarchaeobius chitinivorans]RQG97344.1 hypothetical protein EA473_04390 [Natrarchaeobius chitinivorans]
MIGTVGRVALDVTVIGLWVLFLTILFLGRGWPRWAFYATLLVGVVVYISVTAPWSTGGDR